MQCHIVAYEACPFARDAFVLDLWANNIIYADYDVIAIDEVRCMCARAFSVAYLTDPSFRSPPRRCTSTTPPSSG